MKIRRDIFSFRNRVVVIIVGVSLGMVSLLYTNNMAKRLKEKEQHDVALWAHAMERVNRDVMGGSMEDPLIQDIVSNGNNIPFIITNENLEVFRSHLIPDKIIDHPDRLRRMIDKLTEENPPRTVRFWWSNDHYHIIFYGRSALLKSLYYFPYVQILVITAFIMLGFIAFRSSKHDEQNRVWIGLAKETAHQLGTPTSSLLGWIEYLRSQDVDQGAVEEMIDVCSTVEVGTEVLPLTDEQADQILDRIRGLNERGMRVVGVAQRNDVPARDLTADDEHDMTLIGYLAFLDPPKASAKAAVKELGDLGVAVKVLTGDNAAVAATVCEQVGIDARNMLTGADVDLLSDDELAERAERTGLFAKLSPLQKARIVEVLRTHGKHTVGFMGDGINDAAAMRASDCGISVDTAVDVAKESADIILLKKDLTVLAHGIVDGRRTYGNTIKYIKTTASSNFGNVLSVLAAAAFLPFLPMSALQLLLLGMAYTVSCAALPWDHVDESFLARPRTWDARGIVSFMLGLGPVSSIFDILTFAAMFWVVCPLVVGAPWAALTDPAQRALFALVFQTGWFVESMWTQTLVIHLLRTERLPFVQSRPAASLTLLTMLGVGLVTAMPYVPGVNSALDLVPLPGVFFGVLAAMMAGYLLLTSIAKVLYVRAVGELL